MGRTAWMGALALSLLAPAAHAQRDPAAAEALFQEAKAALDRGELDVACERFRESNQLDPAVGTVFNLADCEERRLRLGTAWALFVEAREKLEVGDERKAEVDQRIAALEPRLSRLTVRLSEGAPAGMRVRRDGDAMGAGSLGAAVVVDPGKHEVVAEADGYEPRRFAIAIAEGDSGEVTVSVGDKLPEAPPDPKQPKGAPADGGDSMSLHPFGLTGIGVGVAAVGVGIALGVVAKGNYDDAEASCPGNVCDQQGFDDRNSAISLSHVGTAVFIAGAVIGAAGIVLEIVELSRDDGADSAARWLPTPWAAPDGRGATGGLSWGTRF